MGDVDSSRNAEWRPMRVLDFAWHSCGTGLDMIRNGGVDGMAA
jgi:hypothetical protein